MFLLFIALFLLLRILTGGGDPEGAEKNAFDRTRNDAARFTAALEASPYQPPFTEAQVKEVLAASSRENGGGGTLRGMVTTPRSTTMEVSFTGIYERGNAILGTEEAAVHRCFTVTLSLRDDTVRSLVTPHAAGYACGGPGE